MTVIEDNPDYLKTQVANLVRMLRHMNTTANQLLTSIEIYKGALDGNVDWAFDCMQKENEVIADIARRNASYADDIKDRVRDKEADLESVIHERNTLRAEIDDLKGEVEILKGQLEEARQEIGRLHGRNL